MRSAFFVAALASILAFPAASVRAADQLSDKAEASSPQGQTPSGIQAAPEGRPRRPSNPQREIAGTWHGLGSIRARAPSIVGSDLHIRAPTQSGLTVNQKTLEKPRTKTKPKTQRPPLWKVILLNDDYTPREFVVLVLKAIFRMNESHAYKVMMTAHQRGACVIAVYTRDVAETKAKEATEMGRAKGFPLYFTTEKEE
jgi:ATP-dependent Clp protease adaptor protein ClpS